MKQNSIEGYSDEILEMLKRLKTAHSEHVKDIEKVISKGHSIELENIDKFALELCHLKHSGKQFEKLVNQFLKDNAKNCVKKERVGLNMTEIK